MVDANYKFLRFVEYKDFSTWAVKSYLADEIASQYPVEKMGSHIVNQTKKVKLFEEPSMLFGILGISNEIGMFDAYEEKGENIKQPYKVVENGYIAYNPYRINVGSIGIKTDALKNSYISPAYIVFSCKKTMLPDFLYLLMRGDRFNTLIRDNTTGSVRQTLGFEILSNIKIPILPLLTQQEIISKYNNTISQAVESERKADELESKIETLLFDELGMEETKETLDIIKEYRFLKFVEYKDVSQWGVDFICSKIKIQSNLYKSRTLGSICKIGSGGTPSRGTSQYYNGDIPWIKTGEVIDEVIYDTEEKITQLAVVNSSAKIYHAGSLIMAMYGQGKTRGRTAKLGIDATTNQACAVLYDIDTAYVHTDFLWAYLQGEYKRIRALAYGNNQPNLNAQMIKDYPVFLPSLEKQRELANKFFEIKTQIKDLRTNATTLREKAKTDFETKVFSG